MMSSLFVSSAKAAAPVRVTLLIRRHAPALLVRILEEIAASNFARVDCVVCSDSEKRDHRSTVLRIYDAWDRSRNATTDDPFAPVDPLHALPGLEPLHVQDFESAAGCQNVVRKLRTSSPDVILDFAGLPRAVVSQLSTRHRVWKFAFGADSHNGNDIPYRTEVVRGASLLPVCLIQLGAEPSNDQILCHAAFGAPWGRNISFCAARARPGWGGTALVMQKLRELHEKGTVTSLRSCESSTENAPPAVSSQSTSGIIRWLAPQISRKAAQRLRPARPEQWRMAIRVGQRRLVNQNTVDMRDFRWIESPPDHFYADPFLIRRDSRTWIFYENYSYSEARAVIDCAEIVEDGRLAEARLALRRECHLSFPQVFEHGGEVFMIPETAGNRTVELYRAIRFPDQWKLEKVLASNISAVDTSLWHDGDWWWFFSTIKEPRGGGSMLFLFFARELTGAWRSHPANPICTDVRYVRGAGSVFQQDGRIFRPNQDCSVRYGYRLNFNEITALTPDEYAEAPVIAVDPRCWAGLIGVHTYNSCETAEAIDGCAVGPVGDSGLSVITPASLNRAHSHHRHVELPENAG